MKRLLPVISGLLLFVVGWLSNARPPLTEPENQLYVSPAPVKLTLLKGPAPVKVADRWLLDGPLSLELSRDGWPKKTLRVEAEPGVTAIRIPIPRATLSVTVKDDEKVEVEFLTLPQKSKVASAQGQARLEAGSHELLLSAPGYLPQRLSVELRPGELKKVAVDLERIPGLAIPSTGSPPRRVPSASAPPSWSPPARVPSAAPPWSPPAARPPRAPAPRFTPVPPAPRSGTPDPQPMFTPIGN